MAVQVKKVGGSLNIDEGQSSGFSTTPKVDINMTMNGSIWNMKKDTNTSTNSAQLADTTRKGDNATADADEADNSAKGASQS